MRTPGLQIIPLCIILIIALTATACGEPAQATQMPTQAQTDSLPISATAAGTTTLNPSAKTDRPDPTATLAQLQRTDEPMATPQTAAPATRAEQAQLAQDNAEFALNLYHELRATRDNLFYSPYSVSQALAMTYAGARGDTERSMADTLHFTLPQERLHQTFQALREELASRTQDNGAVGDFSLHIANAVWGQEDHPFSPAFTDTLSEKYAAGVKPADYTGNPDGATEEINAWVADQTKDRIKNLVPPGAIDPLTRMVLTNAIYFKAPWTEQFRPATPGPFRLLDGSAVTTDMMTHDSEDYAHAAAESYQAVDLPYQGHQTSMTLVVPDEGRFQEVEDSLDALKLQDIFAKLQSRHVYLEMPKFRIESKFRLNNTLKQMGMPNAFDSTAADFSGMDESSCAAGDPRCLYIGATIHQSFISVDEKGTEAAAATAVLMRNESMPQNPVSLTIDRPFIFVIRDRPTGAILFIGRLTDPQTTN